MIAVVLAIAQVTMWSYANSVAQAAADHGAEVAAAFGSTREEGQTAAIDFLASAGTVSGGGAQVDFVGDEQVIVTVTGSYPSVFGSLGVTATTSMPRERLPG